MSLIQQGRYFDNGADIRHSVPDKQHRIHRRRPLPDEAHPGEHSCERMPGQTGDRADGFFSRKQAGPGVITASISAASQAINSRGILPVVLMRERIS